VALFLWINIVAQQITNAVALPQFVNSPQGRHRASPANNKCLPTVQVHALDHQPLIRTIGPQVADRSFQMWIRLGTANQDQQLGLTRRLMGQRGMDVYEQSPELGFKFTSGQLFQCMSIRGSNDSNMRVGLCRCQGSSRAPIANNQLPNRFRDVIFLLHGTTRSSFRMNRHSVGVT